MSGGAGKIDKGPEKWIRGSERLKELARQIGEMEKEMVPTGRHFFGGERLWN